MIYILSITHCLNYDWNDLMKTMINAACDDTDLTTKKSQNSKPPAVLTFDF